MHSNDELRPKQGFYNSFLSWFWYVVRLQRKIPFHLGVFSFGVSNTIFYVYLFLGRTIYFWYVVRQSKGKFLSISEFIPIAVRFNENIILLLLSQFLIIEREIKRERDPDWERSSDIISKYFTTTHLCTACCQLDAIQIQCVFGVVKIIIRISNCISTQMYCQKIQRERKTRKKDEKERRERKTRKKDSPWKNLETPGDQASIFLK